MKKSMTKALSLLVVLTMVMSLTAFGGARTTSSSKTKAPVTISIWSQFSDPKSTDGNSIAFYQALDAIKTALPEIKLEHDGTTGEAYKTKIKTAMAANELPDIFFNWGAGTAKPYVSGGLVLPLNQYLNDGTMNKIIPGTMENFTFDGKIYGLPYSVAVSSLYVNKSLFDKFGIKIPKTYSDLIAAVKAFNARGITPMLLGEKDSWPGLMPFGILATRMAGAKAVNAALDKRASYDTPEMLAAAQKLKELSDLNAFGKNALGTSYLDSVAAFKQGKGAMMFMGSWLNGDIEAADSKIKGKTIAIKFPLIPGGKGNIDEFHGGSGETFMISSSTKYKDEAVKAVKFICEYMSKAQFLAGSGLPAWKGNMGDTSKVNKVSLQVADLTKTSKGYVYWLDVMTSGQDTDTLKNEIAMLIAGKVKPDQFCKDLQKMNAAK